MKLALIESQHIYRRLSDKLPMSTLSMLLRLHDTSNSPVVFLVFFATSRTNELQVPNEKKNLRFVEVHWHHITT